MKHRRRTSEGARFHVGTKIKHHKLVGFNIWKNKQYFKQKELKQYIYIHTHTSQLCVVVRQKYETKQQKLSFILSSFLIV